MKRKKTKETITISVDKNLNEIMNNNFDNKSQYIEWLIYQDMLKNMSEDKTKNIIL